MSGFKGLISEVHRRSLWQVLLIYVGGALVAYQMIQALTEGLHLPEWFPPFAIVLFIIGLPIVLATAFVQEGVGRGAAQREPSAETEDTVAETRDLAKGEGRGVRRLFTWRNAITGGALAFGLWGVVATGWLLSHDGAAAVSSEERKSIAVLPFDNLSPDPQNEFFAAGIHDEIITQLSKISELKVISRTSVMEYKDRPKNLRQIGKELGVATILEGGVRRAEDRVRITAQLIDAQTDEHLWAENYERALTDIFAIQSDVAQHIAVALRATLTPAEKDRIEATPTENLEAYEFYLRGNAYYNRPGWRRADFQNARQMYEKAVALDPGFALAHAGLSMINSRLYHFFYDRSDERLRQARAAADRALELDPDLPEAHLAFAYYHYWGHRAYERALTELAIAQGGLPGNAELHEARGYIYRRQGKWEEAITSLKQVGTLDPRDAQVLQEIGGTYSFLRRYAEAERYFDRSLALAPDNAGAAIEKAWIPVYRDGDTRALRSVLAGLAPGIDPEDRATEARFYVEFSDRDYAAALDALARMDREQLESQVVFYPKPLLAGLALEFAGSREAARAAYDSARVMLEGKLAERPDDQRLHEALSRAYAGLGRRDDAIREGLRAVELWPASKDSFTSPEYVLALAWTYATVGEHGAAIDQLESYLSGPARWSIEGLLLDPRIDPLRDHPRFQALLEKYD